VHAGRCGRREISELNAEFDRPRKEDDLLGKDHRTVVYSRVSWLISQEGRGGPVFTPD